MDGEAAAKHPAPATGRRRTLDPERTRQEILRVAREEFAAHGFSGARVDRIGERTATAKRMIYYYFGNKEGLYLAVLEDVYAGIRAREASLDLDALPPDEAMARLIDFTFDYEGENIDFVRIVSSENINGARFLRRSSRLREVNATALESVGRILARGQADGTFRRQVTALDVHFMISALCFFRVSNRLTFSEIFGCDLAAADVAARHKRMIRETILSYLRAADGEVTPPPAVRTSSPAAG